MDVYDWWRFVNKRDNWAAATKDVIQGAGSSRPALALTGAWFIREP